MRVAGSGADALVAAEPDPERVAEMVALLTRWKSGNEAGDGSGGEAARDPRPLELIW